MVSLAAADAAKKYDARHGIGSSAMAHQRTVMMNDFMVGKVRWLGIDWQKRCLQIKEQGDKRWLEMLYGTKRVVPSVPDDRQKSLPGRPCG